MWHVPRRLLATVCSLIGVEGERKQRERNEAVVHRTEPGGGGVEVDAAVARVGRWAGGRDMSRTWSSPGVES